MRIATNIQWVIDPEQAFEKLDEMKPEQAAECIQVSLEQYNTMSIKECHERAQFCWHHNFTDLEEFMGLPDSVEIPSGLETEEDITEYLCWEYGTFFEGYSILET